MNTVLAIVQIVMGLYAQLLPLVDQAIEAHKTNDTTTLDAILAKAEAAANALAPSGDAPAG